MSLGFTEILLIVIAIVLLFGAKRIPELVKSIARASYEYKKAKELIKKESEEIINAGEETTDNVNKQQTIDVKAEEKKDK
ncbi:twin-arginine translocase TatA/TatE family subunit [Candidatus Ruminimicrobium bovinum]|uniref:Sec-independent protein translocase subunit TatA/TatB n=1 Tax=Candidatus Ruminimicrobium bovinum TaxID=3242779 RepID=UPI0039B9626A